MLLETLDLGSAGRILLYTDDEYQTGGSYGYDTPEETQEAEDYERARLRDGTWEVYGLVHEVKCPACGTWEHEDSVWGIVTKFGQDAETLWTQQIGPLPTP